MIKIGFFFLGGGGSSFFSKNRCGNTQIYAHFIAVTTAKFRLQKRIFIS